MTDYSLLLTYIWHLTNYLSTLHLCQNIHTNTNLQTHKTHTDCKDLGLDIDEYMGSHHSPPLHTWIVPALMCALAYALYNIFIKKGSASIQPILGGVILQFVAALCGTLLLSFLILRGKRHDIYYDRRGLIWATGAGLWVGTAEMVRYVCRKKWWPCRLVVSKKSIRFRFNRPLLLLRPIGNCVHIFVCANG
jgi:uncharacterized membrane protein